MHCNDCYIEDRPHKSTELLKLLYAYMQDKTVFLFLCNLCAGVPIEFGMMLTVETLPARNIPTNI